MRKILALDHFTNQIKEKSLADTVKSQIVRELSTMAELEQESASLMQYLKSRNAKAMQGADHVFKFRLNSGDRILYTLGKYLNYVREDDALVLIAFSEHDKQGEAAKKFDFDRDQKTEAIADVLQSISHQNNDFDNFTQNDIDVAKELFFGTEYTKWHTTYVVSDEDYFNLSREELEVYLSTEQDQILRTFFEEPSPMLIYGGAGSGKTLIAIHLLNFYNQIKPDSPLVFFTQSFELRERTQRCYERLSGEASFDLVKFYDINDYCMNYLRWSRKDRIDLHQFSKFIETHKDVSDLCRKNNINAIDVWTEIRGTIKGAMGKEWTHTEEYLTQGGEFGNVEKLVSDGVLMRNPNNKKQFKLSDRAQQIISDDPNLDKNDILTKIRKYYSSFDPNKRTLSKNEYFSLSEEYSTLSEEKREAVWKICCEYEKYLLNTGKYDDSDLIREVFKKDLPSYDMVVVDEIQDYTELQIYFLYCLASDKTKIAFIGDYHQNINPTHFNISRVNSLFEQNHFKLKHEPLLQNFRCPDSVIGITNKIAELRRNTIANTSSDLEQPETALKKTNSAPMRLRYSTENIRKMMKEVIRYPGVAVLVPDEKNKEMVIDCLGREKYDQQGISFVFTVAEIKGMEYDYVFAVNLTGEYYQIWNDMLSTNIAKRQTKYRYYFNLLYVAMTRTQSHLCLIDNREVPKLESLMELDNKTDFDPSEMCFSDLKSTSEGWIRAAKLYEENSDYRNAIGAYERGNADKIDIDRCKMKLCFHVDRDYEKAMRYCVLSNSTSYCESIYKELSPGFEKELGGLFLDLINGKAPSGENGPVELCKSVFENVNERSHALKILIDLYRLNITNLAKELVK